VHSHRLTLEDGRARTEWRLEWDEAWFILTDPRGRVVLEEEAEYAHRLIGLHELYNERTISLPTERGQAVFKKNAAAVAELREFVEAALAWDAEYRDELRGHALRLIPIGLVLFVVCGGLFGLYCWYAAVADDPPPDHWVRWFGWLIHGGLLVLLAGALAGPWLSYSGLRQWLRLRRIERAAGDPE
jgi:hypothetical protein